MAELNPSQVLPIYTKRCIKVYMTRTNIEINDQLVKKVMDDYGLKTKKEAVDLALHRLVGAATKEEILAMQGIGWVGDLDEMSADRFPDWSS